MSSSSQPGTPSSPAPDVAYPPVRYWTVEEARAYLPRLRGLLDAIRRVVGALPKVRSNGHGKLGGTAPSRDPGGDARAHREAAATAVAELEALSIVLRDPDSGLVDFPALGEDGAVYYLCWRSDDADLAWWHLPEEGFAGRKPLPRDE